jgi:UDP-2-acetamido-2-deoxy-ribo-hexuluronate aminotransferase
LCDVSTHSFYSTKVLGCYGEGGCLLTNDDKIADIARCIRNHGMTKEHYKHFLNAGNYRNTELQSSILNVKLKHKDYYINERVRAVKHYKIGLKNLSHIFLKENPQNTRMVNFVFPIFVEERNELRKYLLDNGISTNINYPIPLNQQPVLQGGRHRCNYLCPNAKRQCDTELSLPLFAGVTVEELSYVESKIHEFFRKYEYEE